MLALAVFFGLPAAALWGGLGMGAVAVAAGPVAAPAGTGAAMSGAAVRPARALVAVGSALAAAGTAHAAVNAVLLRRPDPAARPGPERVSVLVPMRDEAARARDCLAAALAQDGVTEVLVLDDGSTDGTARIARAAGARVLTGRTAAARLAGQAARLPAAGRRRRPGRGRAGLPRRRRRARARARSPPPWHCWATGDLVCPYPRQVAGTAAERLVQPLLQWSWLTFLPLRLAERSPRPSLSAANGQLLAVRRAAYDRAGGHAAVRAEVVEDVALLRAVKRAGGRGGVADGTALADCRMYAGWAELRDGYTKSLWAAFGSPAGAAGVAGLLALAYLVPPLARAARLQNGFSRIRCRGDRTGADRAAHRRPGLAGRAGAPRLGGRVRLADRALAARPTGPAR